MTSYSKIFPVFSGRQVVSKPREGTSPRFLILGDSLLREVSDLPYTDVICVPGTTPEALTLCVKKLTLRYEVVLLHVGINAMNDSNFINKFEVLVKKIQDLSILSCTVVGISSMLPRYKKNPHTNAVSSEFSKELGELNGQLAQLAKRLPQCQFFKTFREFLDLNHVPHWYIFRGKFPGLHLTKEGSLVLQKKLRSVLNSFKTGSLPSLKEDLSDIVVTGDQVAFFGKQGPFSNFFTTPFVVDGELFICMEQFYTVAKARYFGDYELADHLFTLTNPAKMKQDAKFLTVAPGDCQNWRQSAVKLILPGLQAKFSQNSVLKALLLATGDKRLVEASPYDDFWGIRMSLRDPNINSPSKHRGRNTMGLCLEEVRLMLRQL